MKSKPFSQKKLFIFDLDGTLVDAYRAIWHSLNTTLRGMGYPPAGFQKVKQSVGNGDKRFIEVFFRPEDRREALRRYRRDHRRSLIRYARLLPYARNLLVALNRKGKTCAIASNRPSPFTRILLQSVDIRRYFAVVVCADQIRSLKPSPKIVRVIMKRFSVSRSDTVFIGDMTIDLATAARAGVDAVFVRGGSSPFQEAKRFPYRKAVRSLKELKELI